LSNISVDSFRPSSLHKPDAIVQFVSPTVDRYDSLMSCTCNV